MTTRFPSYTKSGPGRVHCVGPGPRRLPPRLDDIGPEWHLSPHAVRERKRANESRAESMERVLPQVLKDLGYVVDESPTPVVRNDPPVKEEFERIGLKVIDEQGDIPEHVWESEPELPLDVYGSSPGTDALGIEPEEEPEKKEEKPKGFVRRI